MQPRARANIDHMVGGHNRLFIMFDDDDRIAKVTQSDQRIQQTGIVALVQADGRFIKHIENARQPRPDLRGEANALALTAGQSAGIARKR